MPTRIVAAVKRLWWGALIIFVDINVDGFDWSNDIVGMALVTWGCFMLFDLRRADRLGQAGLALAITSMVFTVLYSISGLASAFPRAELVSSTCSQIGIAVVAFYLARLLRAEALAGLAVKWETTARWHVASTIAGLVFAAVVVVGNRFGLVGTNADAAFDWALGDNVGLVALIAFVALGLIAGVTWLRAAWAVWKYAPPQNDDFGGGGFVATV